MESQGITPQGFVASISTTYYPNAIFVLTLVCLVSYAVSLFTSAGFLKTTNGYLLNALFTGFFILGLLTIEKAPEMKFPAEKPAKKGDGAGESVERVEIPVGNNDNDGKSEEIYSPSPIEVISIRDFPPTPETNVLNS